MNGIVYLIQPREFLDTNTFKIGMSKSNTTQRLNSYGSGTNIICTRECTNPREVEKALIARFNTEFKLFKGIEFFTGGKIKMIECFDECIAKHVKHINSASTGLTHIDIENLWKNFEFCDDCEKSNYDYECTDYMCQGGCIRSEEYKQIQEIFPNYREDEAFGGTKKLIKIHAYQSPDVIECDTIFVHTHTYHHVFTHESETMITDFGIDHSMCNVDTSIGSLELEYILKIANLRIIEDGKIYDLNDKQWLQRLRKAKRAIKINAIDPNRLHETQNGRSIDFICSNTIINNAFYVYSSRVGHLCYLNQHQSMRYIAYTKINKRYYWTDYLRQYLPYCLTIDKQSKSYWIQNRDYDYLEVSDNRKQCKSAKGDIIYMNTTDKRLMPWQGCTEKEQVKLFQLMKAKFTECTQGLECRTFCEPTFVLLFE